MIDVRRHLGDARPRGMGLRFTPGFWRQAALLAALCLVFVRAGDNAGKLYVGRSAVLREVAAGPADPDPAGPVPAHFTDLWQLYSHAQRIRSGEPLYWPWPDFGPDVLKHKFGHYPFGRMPYPPFLTPALEPLVEHGLFPLAAAWYAALLLALVGYAVCLAALATGTARPLSVAGAFAVVLACPGTFGAISAGNTEPILWALAAVALLVAGARGAAFAVIALIKLWGVWPLLFASIRDGRRVVRGAIVAVGAATAVSMLVLGLGRFAAACRDWALYMLPTVGQGFTMWSNVSLSFAALRLAMLAGWQYSGGPLPLIARVWLAIASTGAPLLAGWLMRRRDTRVQLASVITASLLFAPACWVSYLPGLLAPLAVAIGQARRPEWRGASIRDQSGSLAGAAH